MATSTSYSYVVITPQARQIIYVNQRVDDKSVDKKILLYLDEDQGISVHDQYDEHIISTLFDGGSEYTRFRMYFTRIGMSVKTTEFYNMHGKLWDNEAIRKSCVALAKHILWYETLPAIIGKKRSNRGQEEYDEEGEVCSICHDEYQTDRMIATLKCKHSYHEECIKTWLSRKKDCPMCRKFTKYPFLYRTCSDAGMFNKKRKLGEARE